MCFPAMKNVAWPDFCVLKIVESILYNSPSNAFIHQQAHAFAQHHQILLFHRNLVDITAETKVYFPAMNNIVAHLVTSL